MAEISLRDGIAFVTLPLSELTELLALPSRSVPPPPGIYKGGRYRTVREDGAALTRFKDGAWGSGAWGSGAWPNLFPAPNHTDSFGSPVDTGDYDPPRGESLY